MDPDEMEADNRLLQFRKRGSVVCLESTALRRCGFLMHAFCGRREGISEGPYSSLNVSAKEGDSRERVSKNMEIIARAFGIDLKRFLQVDQIHGEGVLIVDSPGDVPTGALPFDAIVTDRAGLAICVRTADCVPILLADPRRRVIGIVHAGWCGTARKVAVGALTAMTARFACRREDILVALGPAIGACCYEVDGSVYGALTPDLDSAFSARPGSGRWMLDLPAANRLQIVRCGVPAQNISSVSLCTSCHGKEFFSHRAAEGLTGRQLSFIMMDNTEA